MVARCFISMLELSGVTKRYGSDAVAVEALRGIDLSIGAGEMVAIMGPSGCGKSTLLHLLGALDTPSGGSVRLDGRPLEALADRERTELRRTQLGFVFQFFNLVPVLTAAENVALPAVVGRMPAAARAARLAEVIADVGLEGLEDRLPNQLSGLRRNRAPLRPHPSRRPRPGHPPNRRRPPSRPRPGARRRTLRAQRHAPRSARRTDRPDHRSQHGRQKHLHPPGRQGSSGNSKGTCGARAVTAVLIVMAITICVVVLNYRVNQRCYCGGQYRYHWDYAGWWCDRCGRKRT
jgi:putative ABC transport system ATP-binding protein